MSTELPIVNARLDETHDGAWADCPHCGWENGVSWAQVRECTGCKKAFVVAAGPLVQDPQSPEIEVFVGPGGTLFYNDPAVSFP